uniref:Uncharacterized protein n=1 Tax=Panagrolaimus davidi TaxID=227884 RepID=A0A914QG32_9BILA
MYKPELWQFWKLFTSDKLGNVENLFFKNSVDRLLNPQCYNFRLFISKIDFLEFSAVKQILQNGVGCFIAKPENEIQLTSVIFEPCFIQCPPNTSEPIFSIEPVLFENETYHTTIFEEKQIHSGNFEDKLDRGDSTATILLLTFSCLSLIAAIIICILHAFNKI